MKKDDMIMKGDCPYPGFCGWNAGAFGLSDRYGFESVRFFKGSY